MRRSRQYKKRPRKKGWWSSFPAGSSCFVVSCPVFYKILETHLSCEMEDFVEILLQAIWSISIARVTVSSRWLSCIAVSCRVVSCLRLACLVLSCLVLHCFVLSCPALCLVLFRRVLSCVLSRLVLPCFALPCLVLCGVVLSYQSCCGEGAPNLSEAFHSRRPPLRRELTPRSATRSAIPWPMCINTRTNNVVTHNIGIPPILGSSSFWEAVRGSFSCFDACCRISFLALQDLLA